jgi:hypothetical protein
VSYLILRLTGRVNTERVALAAAGAVALGLAVLRDLHGAALDSGIAAGLVLAATSRVRETDLVPDVVQDRHDLQRDGVADQRALGQAGP